MSTRPAHKVEMAFGVGALGDTSSATTSGSTDTANTITCPDAAALRSSTLLDVRMKLSLSDWTPSSPQIIAQKDGGTNNRGWTLSVTSTGMSFAWSDTAHTNALAFTLALALPAYVDGSTHWVRVKAFYQKADAGPVQGLTGMWLAVYVSSNGNTWTPYSNVLGVDYQGAVASATLNPCTGDLILKASAHAVCTVTFYAFEMITDQTATSVARLDLDNRWAGTDTTWTSRRGNVWTAGAAITLATSWVDVTADWRDQATVTPMGRASLLDAFNAGQMTFTLGNADRKYDPANAAGTYYGKLISRVPVRWRSKYASVVYNLFRGVVTGGWPQGYDPGNHDATVAVTATDASVILADSPTPDAALDLIMSAGQSEIGGLAAWWKLDSAQVFRDRSAHAIDLAVSGAPADANPVVNGSTYKARLMVDNCYGNRTVAPIAAYPFTVECWFQSATAADYTTTFTGKTDLLTINDTGIGQLFQLRLAYSGPVVGLVGGYIQHVTTNPDGSSGCRMLDGNPHHIVVVVTASAATIYIDGLLLPSTLLGAATPGTWANPGSVVVGATDAQIPVAIDTVAVWSRSMTAGEISQHSAIGHYGRGVEAVKDRALFILEGANWPGHLVDLDPAAVTRCQPYVAGSAKALDYLRTVEQTERGELFLDGSGVMKLRRVAANFNEARSIAAQHTWAETDYLAEGFGIQDDDTRIVNQADVTRVGGAKSTAADAASSALYGPRSFSVSNALNTTDNDTKAAAGYYVWLGKDQGSRIDNLPIIPDDQPDLLWPLVLAAQIGDLQTIQRTPQGVGAAISVPALIEGVAYTMSPNFDSAVSYALSNQQARSGQVVTWASWAWNDGKVWGP